MTHQLFNLPPQQPLSAAGRVLPGAKLYFYLTGTSTPTPVYTTSALNVAHSQPLIADSGGRFEPIYLDPAITYKATVTDANDVLLYTNDPVNDQLLSQQIIGEYLYPDGSRLVGYRRTEAGSIPRSTFEVLGEIHASALDFVPASSVDGLTDNTAGLQAWLNCGAKNLYLPRMAAPYRATNLTQPPRTNINGETVRESVIRQLGTATGPLLTCDTSVSTDISEGGLGWNNLTLQPRAHASCYGLSLPAGVRASMITSNRLRIHSQQAESHVGLPYTIVTGQRGIHIEDGSASAIFVARFLNLEIRGFETAIYARNVINEWDLHGWLLDNQCGIDIDGCSLWRSCLSHETGVADACAWRLGAGVSNIDARMERWELTQTENYAVELQAAGVYENIHFQRPLVLIPGDGSTWPGRKYLSSDGVRGVSNGTLPEGVVFTVMLGGDLLTIGAPTMEQMYGGTIRIGGLNRGNGKIILGRDIDGAPISIEHDGTNMKLAAANYIEFAGASGASGYEKAVKFGSHYLWVDSTGDLRIHNAAPGSDLAGVVVGSQS